MTSAEIAAALPSNARTAFEDLPCTLLAYGKVREIYDLGDALLLVASDRLSAFDVILPDGIPGKGIILTQMSLWWFEQTQSLIQNHLLPDQNWEFTRLGLHDRDLQLRSMIVRKLKPLAIECVARGYLIGSGWSSYQKSGEVCGIKLPTGLRQAEKLPSPIFTPTTKAPKGQHDEAINDAQGTAIIGPALYEKVKATSLALYQLGHERAHKAGMIGRHQVRIWHRRRGQFISHRRSAYARFIALLARQRLPYRLLAPKLRQTIRARPLARPKLEPETTGTDPSRRSYIAHAGKISRGTEKLVGLNVPPPSPRKMSPIK